MWGGAIALAGPNLDLIFVSELPAHAQFAECVGSCFELDLEGLDAPLTLELVAAELQTSGGDRETFSLVFRGPLDPSLPQRIYAMEHSQLGLLSIFIVPIARQADGMRYEAVFN